MKFASRFFSSNHLKSNSNNNNLNKSEQKSKIKLRNRKIKEFWRFFEVCWLFRKSSHWHFWRKTEDNSVLSQLFRGHLAPILGRSTSRKFFKTIFRRNWGLVDHFNGLVFHFNDFSMVDNFLLQITVIFRISIDRTKIMTTKSSTSSVAPLGVRKVERPRPLRSLSHVGHQTNVNLANAATNRRLSAQDVSTGKYLSGQVSTKKSRIAKSR